MSNESKLHTLDIKPKSLDQLPEDMRTYFNKCQEKLGFIPNVLMSYAFDDAKLRTFIAMHDDLMLGPSGLSKLEREMIAVVVSSHNHCYYCLSAHGALVRVRSGDPLLGDQIVMNYRSADLTDKQRAMLDFAHELTIRPAEVDEQLRQRLRDAEWSDRDIWDIAAVTSFFNMSNRMASAVDMRPNDAYANMAR